MTAACSAAEASLKRRAMSPSSQAPSESEPGSAPASAPVSAPGSVPGSEPGSLREGACGPVPAAVRGAVTPSASDTRAWTAASCSRGSFAEFLTGNLAGTFADFSAVPPSSAPTRSCARVCSCFPASGFSPVPELLSVLSLLFFRSLSIRPLSV